MVSLFHRKTFQERWKYVSPKLIWRTIYAENGLLVGETRDIEKKQASFFCIDSLTGSILWNDVMLSEPWWVGIEDVEQNIVFFHRYAQPELPEHKSIIAYDCKTGNHLWTQNDLCFWFALNDKVYATKNLFEKRLIYSMDASTGLNLTECTTIQDEFDHAYQKKQSTRVQYPIPIDIDPDNESLCDVLQRQWGNALIAHSIETLHVDPYDIVGYYTSDNPQIDKPTYTAHLALLRMQDKKITYSAVLHEHVPMITHDLFFVTEHTVYWIEQQKIIHALPL